MPSHEWLKVDGNMGTVGISDHAQAELGDIVFVELPEVGTEVAANESFGVVESVKVRPPPPRPVPPRPAPPCSRDDHTLRLTARVISRARASNRADEILWQGM